MELKLILPDNLKELPMDDLGTFMTIRDTVRQEVTKQLLDAMVEYAVEHAPELTFLEDEIRPLVKERFVNALVDKALSKNL